jgi:hypothetical protein
MSYLHAVGFVLLFAISAASWFVAVAGASYWIKGNKAWPWTDRIVWWVVFSVAVAATAGVLVL